MLCSSAIDADILLVPVCPRARPSISRLLSLLLSMSFRLAVFLCLITLTDVIEHVHVFGRQYRDYFAVALIEPLAVSRVFWSMLLCETLLH